MTGILKADRYEITEGDAPPSPIATILFHDAPGIHLTDDDRRRIGEEVTAMLYGDHPIWQSAPRGEGV